MKLFKKSDLIFTAAVAVAGLLVWALMLTAPQGKQLIITLGGKQIVSLPLEQDGEFVVHGQYDNVIQISGGRAFVLYTTCPNKACQKSGSVSKNGQSIVCAPNQMAATVSGGSEGGVDAVSE